jgi:hypothetical protein
MFDNGRWLLTNRPPVVLLADKKKAQMDEAVHEMLRCAHHRQTGMRSTCRHTLHTGGAAQVLFARVVVVQPQSDALARMINALRLVCSTGIERLSVCRCCMFAPQGPRAAPGGSHAGGQPLQAVRAQEGERQCTHLCTFTVLSALQSSSSGWAPVLAVVGYRHMMM